MGRYVNAAYRAFDGPGKKQNSEVCKNSGPVLRRLWTKVHKILGQRRRPFVLKIFNRDYSRLIAPEQETQVCGTE